MTSEGTCTWSGKSGREYEYRIYKLPPKFKALAGNYIFAKETGPAEWAPIYISETGDLRFHQQEMQRIREHGATHIHAHENDAGETARREEAEDLVAQWNPPCNQ